MSENNGNPAPCVYEVANCFHDCAGCEYGKETIDLAQQVLDMPSMPRTSEAIDKWAKGLAADISKGTD
jgi:hypothetical protein